MFKLLDSIEKLKNNEIKNLVNQKIEGFSQIKDSTVDDIFKELCFCIMTANCGAEKCIEVHNKIGDKFLELTEEELSDKFKEYGYRFPNVRAKYIIQAREYKQSLGDQIKNALDENGLRDWIVKNIKGIGYKESSHFLRNIGFRNYAIIDFHIIDILVKYNLIEKPKTLTKNKYLEIEEILQNMAEQLNLTLAELDLYLWYMETGKILK